jgi:copper chaperone
MFHFHIPGMTCSGCVGAVTRAVRAIDGTARIETDLAAREITVTSRSSEAAISAALEEAGYPNTAARPLADRPQATT